MWRCSLNFNLDAFNQKARTPLKTMSKNSSNNGISGSIALENTMKLRVKTFLMTWVTSALLKGKTVCQLIRLLVAEPGQIAAPLIKG